MKKSMNKKSVLLIASMFCFVAMHGQTTELTSMGTVTGVNKTQDFTIPTGTTSEYLFIHAEGGDGGERHIKDFGKTRFIVNGGAGASIMGTFEIGTGSNQIPPGSTLRIIIGEGGSTRTTQTVAGCEGGGGTGVLMKKPTDPNWHLLLVAGGGGGAYSDCCTIKHPGKQAQVENEGSKGGTSGGCDGGYDGGTGGTRSSWNTGDGGGIFWKHTDSPVTCGWENGNMDPTLAPKVGKTNYSNPLVSTSALGANGFSFGGSGGSDAGGGGGYSGGGRGNSSGGGGGGSYVNEDLAVDQILIANGTTSDPQDGFVKYEFRNSPLNQKITLAGSNSRCLAVRKIYAEGTRAASIVCSNTGSVNQWMFDGIHFSTYRDKSWCLEAKNGKESDGTAVQLSACNGKEKQEWVYDGRLKSFRFGKNFDKCIAVNANGNLEISTCKNEDNNQVWNLEEVTTANVPSETGSIKLNSNKNQCVNNSNGNTSPGNKIGIFNCKGNDNQRWYFDGARIKLDVAKDRCMILEKGDTKNGNQVYLHICTDKDEDKWAYDGITKQFRSAINLDKCISSNGFGEGLTIEDCVMGDEAQQFLLE